MNLDKIKYAYFLGIGGIGMSAIARYLNALGIAVSGYDKTPSDLTAELVAEGMHITYEDRVETIPAKVQNSSEETLLIYTPAIPKDHVQLNWFLQQQRTLFKRSEVLGMISENAFCIAVAGTHGKTTTSTLIAHLLHSAGVNFTAFLGGISSNYNTNYLHFTEGKSLFEDKPIVVLEADEFDRSFHRLSPNIAVITAIDPDHLDIYGDEQTFREAFRIFASKIKPGGTLIYNQHLKEIWPENIQTYAYGLENKEIPFSGMFREISEGYFCFDYTGKFHDANGLHVHDLLRLKCGLPGFHNMENATAALAVCLDLLDLNRQKLREGIGNFLGAKRRFEYIFRDNGYVVIDDYAHHPEELKAIITSVRSLYPEKNLTVIFQPHLFTRTRDFADGFAQSLALADEVVLMDIYPARELPIPGITSGWLLEKIPLENKILLDETGILHKIKTENPELLLILGAGDIDRIVPKVKEVYRGF